MKLRHLLNALCIGLLLNNYALPALAVVPMGTMSQDGPVTVGDCLAGTAPTFAGDTGAPCIPHFANSAALAAANPALFQNTIVVRDDTIAGYHVPPSYWRYQSTLCAGAGMVYDYGSCIDYTGGGTSWRAIHPSWGLDVRQYHCFVDGISDSIGCLRAVYTEAIRLGSITQGGGVLADLSTPCIVFPGPWDTHNGDYVINAPWNIYPGKADGTQVDLCIKFERGSRLLLGKIGADNALVGAGTIALNASYPGTCTKGNACRGGILTFIDENIAVNISNSDTTTVGPVMFYQNYASGLRFEGVGWWRHFHWNTIFRITGCWNCDFSFRHIWYGGVTWPYKDTSNLTSPQVTFSIAKNGTQITANQPVFDAGDPGHYLTLSTWHGQMFLITEYVDPTHVNVSAPSVQAWTNAYGSFESAHGDMSLGSNVLTLRCVNCVGASDVGRQIWVSGTGVLEGSVGEIAAGRAFVGSLNSGNSVNLVDDDGNPWFPVQAVTNAIVAPSPSTELYSAKDWVSPIDGSVTNEQTNDVYLLGFETEGWRGVGLMIHGGGLIKYTMAKVHGRGGGDPTSVGRQGSQMNWWIDNASGIELSQMHPESVTYDPCKTYYSGLSGKIYIEDLQTSGLHDGQTMFCKDASDLNSSLVIRNVNIGQVQEATVRGAFYNVPDGRIIVDGNVGSVNFNLPFEDTTTFAASGAYHVPPWAKGIRVEAVGQGGGGGSGASGDNTASRFGGCGAGAGAWARDAFRIDDLSTAAWSSIGTGLTVTVGTLANGAASATNANGNAGTPGDDSVLTDGSTTLLTAGGGFAGSGGSTTNCTVSLTWSMFPINNGGTSSVTATANAGLSSASGSAGGGGGGGGVSTASATQNGGNGGWGYFAGGTSKRAQGGAGQVLGVAGCTVGNDTPYVFGKGGGGGGGAGSVNAGGVGCNGGWPGGGGGGGGAARTGWPSGQGGKGGNGAVRITAYR